MDYLQVLSYVCSSQQSFRKKTRTYSNIDLFIDLGFSIKKEDRDKTNFVSPGYASRILAGSARPQKVLAALDSPEVRRRIEENFDLPSLFGCKSTIEIDRLIVEKLRREVEGIPPDLLPSAQRSLFKYRQKTNYEIASLELETKLDPCLSSGERGALRSLARLALSSPAGVVNWEAEPWSGASYVAYMLRQHSRITSYFRLICTIRPSEFEDPFAEQLLRLKEDLKIVADRSETARAICNALRQQRVLLVVSDACFIPFHVPFEKDRLINQVLTSAISTHSMDTPSHIITIGRSPAVKSMVGAHDRSFLLNKSLQSANDFEFYRHIFESYKLHRGDTRPEEGGSRLKRGKWHYEAVRRANDRVVWPGMIRLRAYFASNFANYAYFDPTMGFNALCGSEVVIPKSIELFYDDLVAYLVRASQGRQSPELRAIRFCSTAKHWLSEPALEQLRQHFNPKRPDTVRVPELTKEAFENKVEDRLCPISSLNHEAQLHSDSIAIGKVYTLSLGIRAIAQDEWRRVDPFERAVAHWRVADSLWRNQDDKALLAREFPYVPHWGRSRIFLLGECIRHLICTIDEAKEVSDLTIRGNDNEFPDKPDASLYGCDPSEVINFCYSRIFQKEINGNKAFGLSTELALHGRSLSKRHGAFEYAAELLQLMGKNRCLGIPHPSLNPRFHVSYIRECAFALLDLGDLEQAEAIFMTAEHQHPKESTATLEDRLNLALVLTERHSLMEAEAIVDAVDEALNGDFAEHMPDSQKGALQRRLQTRRIHLACLKGEFAQALELSASVQKSERDPRRWDPEVVHNRIRALANVHTTSSIAMGETMAAVFRSSADGFQHEALGYRVLLARLFRQRGEFSVAEQLLDDTQRDILLYGCSERTYLDMLYEAGRTLCAMDKNIRAYASYLRPLFVRSSGRSFGRFSSLARTHSKTILTHLRNAHVINDLLTWDKMIDAAKKEEETHISKEKPGREGFTEIDPLFGYYIAGSLDVIESFRTLAGIEREEKFMGLIPTLR